ncbi:MAG TPA: DUF4173 domain-containing protein [Gemmatimonadales bacterium]|nr:DUF4173 domain-containing protein [Gemmatimonadales bacterium]
MTPRTRQGLALLGAAITLGFAADALASLVPGRLDVALGLGVLVLVLVALGQLGAVALPGALAPLGAPLALLALALIWRDSPTLFALNLAGVVTVATLAAPRLRAVGRRRAGLGDYALGAAELGGAAVAGAPALVFTDIDWASLPVEGRARRARGTAIGLAAATPVAVVFGGLLMQADPVFGRLLGGALDFQVEPFVSHIARVLLWGWLAAGLLRLLARATSAPAPWPLRGGAFGLSEVGPVLAVVNLLFLAFVAVQFRYLFGGAELVRGLTGLSYAEYARRGFFELVTVAALSLPLLLLADWSLDQRDAGRVRRLRLLAGLMLLLLDVMLASALIRMRLYTVEYGLTELRLYTTAFMGWLVIVFGWFGATVLRGKRERFGTGALLAGWLVLGALNLINPDGVIAGVNLARAASGRPFDTVYAAELSADALPTFRRGLPALATNEACAAAAGLEERWHAELATRTRWTIALARTPREPIGCGATRAR